jgi:hypothetical protein
MASPLPKMKLKTLKSCLARHSERSLIWYAKFIPVQQDFKVCKKPANINPLKWRYEWNDQKPRKRWTGNPKSPIQNREWI